MFIKPELAYSFAKLFYKNILRGAVVDIVVDSKTKWDDGLLELCDRIFNYHDDECGVSVKELRRAVDLRKEV